MDPDPYPDSTGSLDPDPGGKNRKKLKNFILLSAGCFLIKTEGFSCSLDVLGGLGIIAIFDKKKDNSCIFLKFLVIKSIDPEPKPDQDSLEMLDPDPYPDSDSMNPDPQHW